MSCPRLDEARKQAALTPVSIGTIVELINEFLWMCGINCVKEPKVGNDKLKNKKEFYEQVKKNHNFSDT